jgi:hypothetical protein
MSGIGSWRSCWPSLSGRRRRVRRPGPGPRRSVSRRSAGSTTRRSSRLGDGRAVIAWSRRLDELHSWLAVRLREPGAGWGPVRYLNVPQDGQNTAPAVAVGRDGDVMIAWAAGDHFVRVAEAPPGRGFGGSVVIGAEAGGAARLPFVALDARGGAIALWEESDSRVHYAIRPPGAAFGPEQTIADPPGFDIAEDPSYAAAANGDAVAAWIDRAGHVFAALRAAGATSEYPNRWSPATTASAARTSRWRPTAPPRWSGRPSTRPAPTKHASRCEPRARGPSGRR